MPKLVLDDIASGYATTTKINSNNAASNSKFSSSKGFCGLKVIDLIFDLVWSVDTCLPFPDNLNYVTL